MGSIASQAFSGNPVYNFTTLTVVLLTGCLIGTLAGFSFHDLISDWFSNSYAKRLEKTGDWGVSFFGLIISMFGLVIILISFKSASSDITEGLILGGLIIITGILFSVLPFLPD